MKATRINSPEIPAGAYQAIQGVENYLNKSDIPFELRELIKIKASQINGCGFCLDMHYKDALKGGVSKEKLYLLPAYQEAPIYEEDEKAVLRLTEVLTRLSDFDPEAIEEAYDKVAAYYNKAQIVNLVLAISQINSWNRIALTFGNIPGSYQLPE